MDVGKDGGKKRYDVATVEKKIEMNETPEVLASIPMTRAFARKKMMIGMRGRRTSGEAWNVDRDPGGDRKHPEKVREHLSDNDR